MFNCTEWAYGSVINNMNLPQCSNVYVSLMATIILNSEELQTKCIKKIQNIYKDSPSKYLYFSGK